MSVVTLILPKDRSILEKKYAEKLAEIVSRKLTAEEIQYLITELEKKN
jgi:hypothetical protein